MALEKIIELQYDTELPEPLTFNETSSRKFEENWWNDIKFLAQGEFIYKDNADIMLDDTTLSTGTEDNTAISINLVIILLADISG